MCICKSKNITIFITFFLLILLSKPAFAAEQASFNYESVEHPRLEIQQLLESHPESIEVITRTADKQAVTNDFLAVANSNATINRWNKYTTKKLDNGQTRYVFYPEYKSTSTLLYAVQTDNHNMLSDKENALLTQATNILNNIITEDMTDYQRAKIIYQYIIENAEYDYAALNDILKRDMPTANATGIFENKTGICLGYADAYYLLCNLAGVDSRIVVGYSPNGGYHAWNCVQINGQTYYIDATWGDEKNPSDFFCKTFDEFQHKGYQILTV